MLHPDTRLHFISDEMGYGVFATRKIPRGTITWALDPFDQLLTPKQVAGLPARSRGLMEKYGYIDAAGNYVLCWDFGRFMNHSCEPTTCTGGATFDLAVRDIQPGMELTYDYASLNITTPFVCRCGSASCPGMVQPNPHWKKRPEWTAAVRGSLPLLAEVPQPLRDLVEQDILEQAYGDQGLELPIAIKTRTWSRAEQDMLPQPENAGRGLGEQSPLVSPWKLPPA